MNTSQIGKKVELESFLIKEVKDITGNAKAIKAFLSQMASDYDTLNRMLIVGEARVHMSHKANLNYAGTYLDDAVIKVSNAGGIEVSEPRKHGFYMRVVAAPIEGGRYGAVEVRADESEIELTEITLNTPTGISADISFNHDSKIYSIESVDKNSAVLLRDSHFWQELGQANGLRLEAIEPQYTDKKPTTPWYRATDESSKAILTMGWRWSVDEIGAEFKEPVLAKRLNELFGDIATTKYVDGNWTGKEMPNEGLVKSFAIHAHSRDDTRKYASQLLEVARQR